MSIFTITTDTNLDISQQILFESAKVLVIECIARLQLIHHKCFQIAKKILRCLVVPVA